VYIFHTFSVFCTADSINFGVATTVSLISSLVPVSVSLTKSECCLFCNHSQGKVGDKAGPTDRRACRRSQAESDAVRDDDDCVVVAVFTLLNKLHRVATGP